MPDLVALIPFTPTSPSFSESPEDDIQVASPTGGCEGVRRLGHVCCSLLGSADCSMCQFQVPQ